MLLAIPFFTFMGAILERCGLAEDLLEGTGQLFGGVPGGLAYAVIVVGAILGAITGTVAASVIAMGVISLPIMLRYGYHPRLATGVIAASGTITQLIPPSLVLIVLADQLGRSVGDMYKGAFGPSIVQVAHLHAVHLYRVAVPAENDAAAAGRSAHVARLGAVEPCAMGHGAVDRADLPGAWHDLRGHRDPDRGRRAGCGRCDPAGGHASPIDVGADTAGDGIDDAADRDGRVHPDRLDASFRWCFRASTATCGSSTCWPGCRAGRPVS